MVFSCLILSFLATGVFATELQGIRATNDLGHTRVVLDLKDKPSTWDIKSEGDKSNLSIILPDTQNVNTLPIQYTGREGVLRNVLVTNGEKGALKLTLEANQPVMHNIFFLEKPDRMVIDLFTNYEQKTTLSIGENLSTTHWAKSGKAGRLQMVIAQIGKDNEPFFKAGSLGATPRYWYNSTKAPIIIPVQEQDVKNKSVNTGTNDNNIGHAAMLTYHKQGGYFISPYTSTDKQKDQKDMLVYMGGESILQNDTLEKSVDTDTLTIRDGRILLGVTAEHNLIVLVVFGQRSSSVGVTRKEGAALLQSLGAIDGMEVSKGLSVGMSINGVTDFLDDSEVQWKDVILFI